MNQQLSLPIHQIDDETLENFYSDNNALLLNSLRQNMTDLQQQFFYLWGNQSVGKTHLLRALCNEYIQQQRSAIYVPLNKSQYFSTAVLIVLKLMVKPYWLSVPSNLLLLSPLNYQI